MVAVILSLFEKKVAGPPDRLLKESEEVRG